MEQGGLNAKDKAKKRITQMDKVLSLLVERGEHGATSEELNALGVFRYSAVIHTLRHKYGHDIETMARKKTELVKYVYHGVQAGPTQLELLEFVS